MKKSLLVALVLTLLGSTGLSFAQDANGDNPSMSPKARLDRQHRRIEQGVKDGKITSKEHRQLAREGRKINEQRKADLRKDGGRLTHKQRKKLEKEENHRSGQIYNDKH
jgi:hypothetical protein